VGIATGAQVGFEQGDALLQGVEELASASNV
jgi:hypothetical protein